MTVNNTEINLYDQNGAIIYTIVILLFYSLSLFCSLILNIDPDDYHYDKSWSIDRKKKQKRILPTTRVDILNALSDPSIRQKYWRIYYGDDEYERRAKEFLSEESKRLSMVSQRIKELNLPPREYTYSERMSDSGVICRTRHTRKCKRRRGVKPYNGLLFEQSRNDKRSIPLPQSLPDPSVTSFLSKFRRGRSTSFPFVSMNSSRLEQSVGLLTETPLCKPSS